jgi:hypothetical protein
MILHVKETHHEIPNGRRDSKTFVAAEKLRIEYCRLLRARENPSEHFLQLAQAISGYPINDTGILIYSAADADSTGTAEI